ncbi:hypothetical protein QZH41_009011, partial [Actinostola sp. cb2023]
RRNGTAAVFDKEAALSNCWGFVDGTKGDDMTQGS